MHSVLWHCWLGGRKGIWSVKTEWQGAGVIICLEWRADLHMAQLMPLPLTVSCFSKIQIGFAFLVPAHLACPRKGAGKRVCLSYAVFNVFNVSVIMMMMCVWNLSKLCVCCQGQRWLSEYRLPYHCCSTAVWRPLSTVSPFLRTHNTEESADLTAAAIWHVQTAGIAASRLIIITTTV